MKILWHSNSPLAPTGYGKQTAVFTPRIRDMGHDVAISAVFGLEGTTMTWNGMHVYPGDQLHAKDKSKWGNTMLPYYLEHHAAGAPLSEVLLITLIDVWVLEGAKFAGQRVASWVPVDHDPLPPKVIDFFQHDARPIAMSRFGERCLQDADLDPLYVPHGIDTTVFRPLGDKAAVRQEIGAPTDAFIVGMVANNQGISPPRKAFPQVFGAFAELRRRHDDAMLYLHSDLIGANFGLNLIHLAQACGIPEDAIAFTDQLQLHLGVPDEQMARIYNTFDVLCNPSYGEGFGIPIVEAQACGVPVVVNDFSAMPELCGAGWTVGGEPWWDGGQGSFFQCPSISEIAEALEAAYQGRGDTHLSACAVEFAAAYDADRVAADYWKPTLAVLDAPREVGPLGNGSLNRQQRRALAKAGA